MNTQLDAYQKNKTGDFVVPISEACDSQGLYSEAFPTGYNLIDSALQTDLDLRGGFRDGDLAIVTGKSGDGKTTFAQNMTLQAMEKGFASLWFSYEIKVNNIYAKFRLMGATERSAIYTPKKLLSSRTDWIGKKIIEAKEKYLIKFAVIDSLDFLTPTDKDTSDQYRMVLRNICHELKDIAMKSEVIIVLMAHIKKVQGRQIEMEDIAESAGIYQLADYVFLVKRDVAGEGGLNSTVNDLNEGSIKILKNRLTGNKALMKFKYENNLIKPI